MNKRYQLNCMSRHNVCLVTIRKSVRRAAREGKPKKKKKKKVTEKKTVNT